MTPAEKAFHEAQKKKETEKIKKLASESHKKKIEKFNQLLDSLPTHFDIPKVQFTTFHYFNIYENYRLALVNLLCICWYQASSINYTSKKYDRFKQIG